MASDTLTQVFEKKCSRCRTVKPVAQFSRDKAKRDGRCSNCKECAKNTHAVWAVQNAGHKKAHDTAYREANRALINIDALMYRIVNRELLSKKAVEYNRFHPALARHGKILYIKFTSEQFDQKMSMWNFSCWMCGGPFESVDHVKPKRAGGAHILANLRPACLSCNKSKKDKWPIDTARGVLR